VKAIYNTIWLFVGATIPQLIIALLLAFIINTPYTKGKDFFRAAFFAPNVAAAVAVSLIFTSLLGMRYGMLNYALGFFGIGPVDWLGSSTWIKPSIAMVTIWQWTGYSMIIFLAGLQSINPELYEAARVDGAQTRDKPCQHSVEYAIFGFVYHGWTRCGCVHRCDRTVLLAVGARSLLCLGVCVRT
jgi:ABC-type sugar transport system permease subunit